MQPISNLADTLRDAIAIYRELLERGAANGLKARLGKTLSVYENAVDRIGSIDPSLIPTNPKRSDVSRSLGDWASGSSPEAVVEAIEREIQRLSERVYSGDASTDLKRVVEDVLERCDSNLGALSGGSGEVEERFALTSENSPENGENVEPGDGELPEKEVEDYRVWYGTNRKPINKDDFSKGFGTDMDDRTHFGSCSVYVPESHKIGSIGSNVLIRILRREDDRLKITKVEEMSETGFIAAIDDQLLGADEGSRQAVVFIHGYNVSFRDAALRTAQIGYDLGIGGAMAFFSWPSKGRLRSYLSDGEKIATSRQEITDFLVMIATLPNVDHVHLIAHSMGNRGALAAIGTIAADVERLSGRRFGQFILAAADVPIALFRKECGPYLDLGDRTTVYISKRDSALAVSAIANEHDRLGHHPPISVVPGFDTVDVGDIDLETLGHGYVGANRGVLQDIHALIMHGSRPELRFGIEERFTDHGDRYWGMKN